MYLLDASLTPAMLTASPSGPFRYRAGKPKELKSNKTAPRADGQEVSNARPKSVITPPDTIVSTSQAMASSSSINTPRRRTRSITSSGFSTSRKSRSMQNMSLSVVSAFFSKNMSPARSNTVSSTSASEDKYSIFSRPTLKLETTSSPDGTEPPIRRKHTRSSSGSIENYRENGSGSRGLRTRSFLAPSFVGKNIFGSSNTPSSTLASSLPRSNTPGIMASKQRKRVWPIVCDEGSIDCYADGYFENDACSTVSSIHFATDPDEKPPKKRAAGINVEGLSTLPENAKRTLPDSMTGVIRARSSESVDSVIDICAENRVEEPEDEDLDRDLDDDRWNISNNKLFRTLGEMPCNLGYDGPSGRRHSFAPLRSQSSHTSTSTSSSHSSPTINNTPLSNPNLDDTPPSGRTSTSPRPQPDLASRKRQSNLLRSSLDSLTAILRPTTTHESLYKSPSLSAISSAIATPRSTRNISPPTPTISTSGNSDPAKPFLLTITAPEYSPYDRNSMVTNESLSDLHRLPFLVTDALSSLCTSDADDSEDEEGTMTKEERRRTRGRMQLRAAESLGAEQIIDPNASSDTLVSPIVFSTPSDCGSYEKQGVSEVGERGYDQCGADIVVQQRDQRQPKQEHQRPLSATTPSPTTTPTTSTASPLSTASAIATPPPISPPPFVSSFPSFAPSLAPSTGGHHNDYLGKDWMRRRPCTAEGTVVRVVRGPRPRTATDRGRDRVGDRARARARAMERGEGEGEGPTWVGEWNMNNMQDVIRKLRALK
ncbi:hypothetical protein AX17_001536 [Amanita inopinata Kibby_2008]|nr:hypothetical protein AX17_001536 [Amanita inopinata Kibby_2008]